MPGRLIIARNGLRMRKILVDTNVILRCLLEGDDLLPSLAKESLVWLPNEVIFETAFTLLRVYKLGRADVFDLLTELLMKPNIESDRIMLFNALTMFRDNPKLGLVDSYLANLSETEKVELVTYDKKLARQAGTN